MESEYDHKFGEMKKYIPFLECMIDRLENNNQTSEQPRRAQLDKIRSLRDLLIDKKKRMKMENLLKCEQVLVNLYAKMEQQTDFIPKMNSKKTEEKADFDFVRNKLKSVVSKSLAEEDNQSDTFEIASRSETEELCTSSGSKEPALFQRRANTLSSQSERNYSLKPMPKRNYTRVLVSPEQSANRWTDDMHSGMPLFRRRSPRKSPKKSSPTYHKKERKKSSSRRKKTSKDLNITLNVPEESLSSLDTKDIVSRIINCNDNDVDISTLRDVREQILGELQQTGAGDITEAIMKSYKKKSKKAKSDKNTDVEEGELSDSESEAIKSIYGSLVLVDKDKNTSENDKLSNEKGNEPRKIQICLVINKINKDDHESGPTMNDVSEFEPFDIDSNKDTNVEKTITVTNNKTGNKECVSIKSESIIEADQKKDQEPQKETKTDKIQTKSAEDFRKQSDTNYSSDVDINTKKIEETNKVPFKPNFYKSINEQDTESVITQTETKNPEQKSDTKLVKKANEKELDEKITYVKTDSNNKDRGKSNEVEKEKKYDENDNRQDKNDIKIPLLNEDPPVPPPPKEQVVSEIDILQALKNEILSENIGISAEETSTPLLHQPKVTKVANAQEVTKKRISIEKYKEIAFVTKKSLFLREPSTSSAKDDIAKKQSLKLTEKECERFNFPSKLALDDSSDEEEAPVLLDDIYGNLVPKSPERENISNMEYSVPVIIPVEPVKPTVDNFSKDIDMRKLPMSPPTINLLSPSSTLSPSASIINLVSPTKCNEATKIEKQLESVYRPPKVDPRLKWESNMSANARSPNYQTINSDMNSRIKNHPNMTPSMTPSRTSSMTPNVRTYEMTPSRQPFEFDDNSSRKHVYAPILSIQEPLDKREISVSKENQRQPHWEPHSELSPEGRRPRWESSELKEGPNSREWGDHSSHREQTQEFHKSRYDSRRDRYGYDKRDEYSHNRSECPRTPVHTFGRSDCPTTPSHPFGRSECPMTPSHPFGRSEHPMTPSHPFGRSEAPLTPSHSFGRCDASMTPSHSFGRSDAPMTPSHQFGRSDTPMTTSHPFGRSDASMTPSHPFGRSDYSHNSGNKFHKDPRLNRSTNLDSTSRNYDNDREFNDWRNISDNSRNFRERSIGRSDRTYDINSHGFSREPMSHHEPNVGHFMRRDSNKFYSADRIDNRIPIRYENERIHHSEVSVRRGFQRDHSVGRGTPSTDRYRSSSRGPSNYSNNTLSVEPQSGHSFTIDTSVNRTFQEFLNQKNITPFAPSFDERRQRTSSVGRQLLPDPNSFNARRQRSSSVGRALLPEPDTTSFDARRRRASSVGRSLIPVESIGRNVAESSVGKTFSSSRNFSRAQSIGRDTVNYKNEKTFKEIKADFQSYSDSLKFVYNKSEKQIKYVDPRTRKDRKQRVEQKWVTKPYSPRKNPRDPRFRREVQYESRHRSFDEKNRERKKHEIVYSNDNIAKGTILGSGYGVKNYKIPKIKRPVDEKVELTENKKSYEKKESENYTDKVGKKDKATSKIKKEAKEQPKKLINIKDKDRKSDKEKSSLKNNKGTSDASRNNTSNLKNDKFSDFQAPLKSRKSKRAVITDSDSDDGDSLKEKENIEQKSLPKEKAKPETDETPKSSDVKSKGNQDDLLDTSFGMDDLEIPDNINVLIADLDSDLGDDKIDKCGKFTKELSIENLFEKIESPEDNEMTVEESLKDLSDLINADLDNPELKKPPESNMSENKYLKGIDTERNIVKEIEKELELQSSENLNKNSKIYIPEIQSNKEDENIQLMTVNDPKILRRNQLEIESNVNDNQSEIKSTEYDKISKTLAETQIEHPYVTPVKESFGNKVAELQDDALVKTITPKETQHSTDDDKNENIVSTTNIGKEALDVNAQKANEQITELSTPDSTIDSNETPDIKEHLPDSTNVINNEMHSDVTSSHETADTSNRLEPPAKDAPTELSSVENLLNFLQDKSKIRQILSMMSNDKTSENEKLKKKLVKLSEIVSDDEDANDATVNKVTAASDVQDSLVEKEPNKTKENKNKKEPNDTNDNKNESIVTDHDNKNKSVVTDSKETNEIVNKEQHETKLNFRIDDKTLELEVPSVAVKTLKEPGKKIKKRKKKLKAEKAKRMTRSGAAAMQSFKAKPKENRELKELQKDLKEMFIKNDVLNSTGIRMCRLAKLAEEKNANEEDDAEPRPIVLLEKFKPDEVLKEKPAEVKVRRKPGPKPKLKPTRDKPTEVEFKRDLKPYPKLKPGPKSKTKLASRADPYHFEANSDSDTKNSDDSLQSSDSEGESLASSASFGSSEVLAELKKKPKRKRGWAWQAGVIKPKKKKKIETKSVESPLNEKNYIMKQRKNITLPDMDSFTDKSYCFRKNFTVYPCRLCEYSGDDIIHHYKTRHPHSEIPLSRINPETARDAIKESGEINFQAISKMSTEKYVCRFCCKELISKRKDTLLETFFWHVVSMHTGEYKQLCSKCINVTRCPFNLDIPPPPKDVSGQLIGYICEKCNFTQLSVENLKTHVIVRHNDEQTSVYMINLSFMSKKTIKSAMEQIDQRVLRSSRSSQSVTEQSDGRSDIDALSDITESTDYLSETDTQKPKSIPKPVLASVPKVNKLRSKLSFETEDNASDTSNVTNTDSSIKMGKSDEVNYDQNADKSELNKESELSRDKNRLLSNKEIRSHGASDDVVDLPHFKVSFNDTGAKEYVCCINGVDNHYKTSLLISIKKHVQMKHKENWDGYCSICKVIVMPQGSHTFKDCFQHLLDSHIDNFPVLDRNAPTNLLKSVSVESASLPKDNTETVEVTDKPSSPKTFINVRPLSELISKHNNHESEESSVLPVIENVISLGVAPVDPPQASPTPTTDEETPVRQATSVRIPTPPPRQTTPSRPPSVPPIALIPQKPIDYEKYQADIIAKKQKVVLDTMMSRDTLVHIFKCAGRYCCFSTDSAEHALLHASTHQRLGDENSLICAYCDFDCSGNAIDLVTHVFKVHGRCQFACDRCFYRAVASQLVSAHMTRAHGETASKGVVLKTATVTPGIDAPTEQLSREVAVAYYTCVNAPNICKYKTYIELKFAEHLAKHEQPFLCNICPVGFPVETALLEHLKCHDMKLYQCTWCVHGADDEAGLLAHAAACHPLKVPQAYLRVVTTREAPDGTLKMMVLPLAQFNNSVVTTELVTPCNKKESPAREAERAVELEKLMSVFSTANNSTDKKSENDVDGMIKDQADKVERLLPQLPRITTPPPTIRDDLSMQTTPVLKTETVDSPVQSKTITSEVISLDSEDEDSSPSVIDLSGEDVARSDGQGSEPKEVPVDRLYKCSKQNCSYVCKRVHLFKKHLEFSCFQEGVPMKCAHCPTAMNSIQAVIQHYDEQHGVYSPNINVCGICGLRDPSLANLKRHFRSEHSSKNLGVSSKIREDGTLVYTVRESPCQTQKTTPPKGRPGSVSQRQKPGPKRKLSGGNLAESPAKKKRYGPQDVDQLPAKPILDELVYCGLCEFSTKVRLNLVRHLQLHAEKQPVAQTVPVNPVPHLETNEKHFDKMVNLASSSIVTRAPDKPPRTDPPPSISLMIPTEAASRYPKYVSERQRLTCGAKGCSYTSVDEGMLKRHWETLHTDTNDYHCVHCPPYQHLDTSKPLTAARIIAHLKMHDIRLYACTSCSYYHYKRNVLEKHLNEVHQGLGQVMVVREEGNPTTHIGISQQPPSSGPTMDLKPWQCGLCKFKSMLRQEVVEHCAKFHNSKMQFKCPNCLFRSSTIENVMKHQSKSHPGSTEEIIYFYYRDGSIPDDVDGTPRWMKQRQRTGTVDLEVKEEVPDKSIPETSMPAVLQSLATAAVDLNIVKKEFPENAEESIENLCKKYGQFCEPNGLKYKCPLCKIVDEDSKESMQSHLFEELQYRKWGCSMCTYKAFHKTGLNDHMLTEHRQNRDPIEIPVDPNVEKWVAQLLQHQTDMIGKTKENFAKQKIQVAKARITSSVSKTQDKPIATISKTKEELEHAFGPLGAAEDNNYCCPKCPFKTKDHSKMQDHLESELNKIRWRCSHCGGNFQEYHEAQLHCRTAHSGAGARPVEALRDPSVRAAWVTTVLRLQRQTLSDQPSESPSKSAPNPVAFIPAADPLLEVRYEMNVPTPEEEMLARRKRPASSLSHPESDDERLVIDEQDDDEDDDDDAVEPKKKNNTKKCPHCNFNTIYINSITAHILRHYNLKPYTCGYCDFNCHSSQCKGHNETCHPHLRNSFFMTKVPSGPPTNLNLVNKGRKIFSTISDQSNAKEDRKPKDEMTKMQVICLVCEKSVLDSDRWSHIHENHPVHFGKKGEVVVKCCNCWILLPNVEALKEHHNTKHYNAKLNYAYYRLSHDTREIHACEHCDKRFKFLRDLKSHHNAVHGTALQLKYTMKPYNPSDVQTIDLEVDKYMVVEPPVNKKVAKKSTTKLPAQAIAKKSTTKLPFFHVETDSESEEEYSYYGARPLPLGEYTNVTTSMPHKNEHTTVSVKQLSEIIKVDPLVVVKDINKK